MCTGKNARVTAEKARATAETAREEAETNRASAEAARESAEEARETASATAVSNCEAATETLINQINRIAFTINSDDGGLDAIVYKETE